VPIRTRFGRAMARKTRKSLRLRADQRRLSGLGLVAGAGEEGGDAAGLSAGAVLLLCIKGAVMGHYRFRANVGTPAPEAGPRRQA
jgi:hypothetical protein